MLRQPLSLISFFILLLNITACSTTNTTDDNSTPENKTASRSGDNNAGDNRPRTIDDFSGIDTNLLVIIDCLVFDDVDGDTHLFNQSYNNDLCTGLSQAVANRLSEIGVDNFEFMAISGGLQAGPNRYADSFDGKSIHFPQYYSDKHLEPGLEELSFSQIADGLSAPVGENFARRPAYVDSLFNIRYRQFDRLTIPDDHFVLLLLTNGIRVEAGKSAVQGIASTVLSLGLITAFETTYIESRIVILDSSGNPVWGDVTVNIFSVDSTDEYEALSSKIFRTYPSYSGYEGPKSRRRRH